MSPAWTCHFLVHSLRPLWITVDVDVVLVVVVFPIGTNNLRFTSQHVVHGPNSIFVAVHGTLWCGFIMPKTDADSYSDDEYNFFWTCTSTVICRLTCRISSVYCACVRPSTVGAGCYNLFLKITNTWSCQFLESAWYSCLWYVLIIAFQTCELYIGACMFNL